MGGNNSIPYTAGAGNSIAYRCLCEIGQSTRINNTVFADACTAASCPGTGIKHSFRRFMPGFPYRCAGGICHTGAYDPCIDMRPGADPHNRLRP